MTRRVQSMKIDHRESNRSIDCNRWQIVIDWYRAIDDQSIVTTKFCRRHRLAAILLFPDSSRRIVRSLSFCFRRQSSSVSKESQVYLAIYNCVARHSFIAACFAILGRRTHDRQRDRARSFKTDTVNIRVLWGLVCLQIISIRHHHDSTRLDMRSRRPDQMYQNRFQSMTNDGDHFIDCNR